MAGYRQFYSFFLFSGTEVLKNRLPISMAPDESGVFRVNARTAEDRGQKYTGQRLSKMMDTIGIYFFEVFNTCL
jgi:hypothetical protein